MEDILIDDPGRTTEPGPLLLLKLGYHIGDKLRRRMQADLSSETGCQVVILPHGLDLAGMGEE